MRKAAFIAFVLLGALLGLLSAAQEGWGTRVVMMGVGILFAVPIGVALAGIKGRGRKVAEWPEVSSIPRVTSPKELARNFWRDQGHPPFMKPSDAPPDRHQFDPDRLG
jgi:hypothetical protein